MEHREHCAEHEERTLCIGMLKSSIGSIKWTIGTMIAVLLIVFSVQWGLLSSINTKVSIISEDLAYFKGKIEAKR